MVVVEEEDEDSEAVEEEEVGVSDQEPTLWVAVEEEVEDTPADGDLFLILTDPFVLLSCI